MRHGERAVIVRRDVVVVDGLGELHRVGAVGGGHALRGSDDPAHDLDLGRVQPAAEDAVLQRARQRRTRGLPAHRVVQLDLVDQRVTVVVGPQPHVQPSVAVDDVVATTTLDDVRARATEDDVAGVEGGRAGRQDRCQPVDPGDSGSTVERVVIRGCAITDEVVDDSAVPSEHIVLVPTGKPLDQIEAVSQVVDAGRQQPGDIHVGIGGARIALVGGPVESEHALGSLNSRAHEHDVVAALGVVILLAAVSVDDVVTAGRVVLEGLAGVALKQVEGAEASLDPIVAIVTENGVHVVAGEDEVVATSREGLGHVVAAHDEVLAGTSLVEVAPETSSRRDRVVARTTLDDVVTVEVLEDVVAGTTDEMVSTVTTLDSVIAPVSANGVVTFAGEDPVPGVVATVEDHMLRSGESDHRPVRARDPGQVGLSGLVDIGSRRVIDDGSSDRTQVRQVENQVRPREDVGRKALDVGVASHQLGERVALELDEQVEALGTCQVVEAVTELQVLQLGLEDVVEGRAEQPAPDHLLFRESADPEVDQVEAGLTTLPGSLGEHEVRRCGVGLGVGCCGRFLCCQNLLRGHAVGDDSRHRRRVDQLLGCRPLVGHSRRRGDRNVFAVGRDEVDQRVTVLEVEPEIRPARVRRHHGVVRHLVEGSSCRVERGDPGVAGSGDVDRCQVQRQPQQVVAQRLGHELVDLVADLTAHPADHVSRTLGRCDCARGELLRIEERLDQAKAPILPVRARASDLLGEHGVAEPVDGMRELRADGGVGDCLVACAALAEGVDHRLDLASELFEDQVLILHLGNEAGSLENALAITPAARAAHCLPRGSVGRSLRLDQSIDLTSEPIVL